MYFAKFDREVQPIIIVGAPRSGTTWLHTLLSEFTGVAGLPSSEQTIFNRYLRPWYDRWRHEKANAEEKGWQQGLPVLFDEADFFKELRRQVHWVYSELLSGTVDPTHVIDKHPAYAFEVDLIFKVLPEARVVQIIRDGREVAISMRSAANRRHFGTANRITGAQRWQRHVRSARQSGDKNPDQYMEVYYHALLNDGESTLSSILAFCGIEANRTSIREVLEANHFSRKQVSSPNSSLDNLRTETGAIWRAELSHREAYLLEHYCGSTLREFPGGGPGWWKRGPLKDALAVAGAWMYRVRASLKKRWPD